MTSSTSLSGLPAVVLLAAGVAACSGPQTGASRYDQLVRCNAVTVIVAGALPPTSSNAGEIRAAAGRIPAALAREAQASGKTAAEVVNDIKAEALRLEADSRAGDADRKGERLVDEARGCARLVPA